MFPTLGSLVCSYISALIKDSLPPEDPWLQLWLLLPLYVPCRSTYLNSIIKTKNCKIYLNKFETVDMFQNSFFFIFSTSQCSHIFKSRYCETQTQPSAPGRLITYPHIRTYPWHHHTVFIIPFKARSEMETISLHFLILNLFRGYHQVFQ